MENGLGHNSGITFGFYSKSNYKQINMKLHYIFIFIFILTLSMDFCCNPTFGRV